MVTKYIAIYITAKDREEAEKIAGILLRKRLIACANTFSIKSGYWWKGRIEEHPETAVIAKTKKSLYKKILAEVKKHHSYSAPCVNALPILEGNPDYFKWVDKETQ